MCLTKTRLNKVRVTGVYITDILDVKTLQKQGIVTVKEDAPSYITTRSGIKYNSIYISKCPYLMS